MVVRGNTAALVAAAMAVRLSTAAAGLIVTTETPTQQASMVSGAQTFDFDGLAAGRYTSFSSGGSAPVFSYSSAAMQIVNPDQYGGSYQTKYLAVGSQSGGTSVTLQLDRAYGYIGIYWPAGDAQNVLEFYKGGTLQASYSMSRLTTLLPGLSANNPQLGSYSGNPNSKAQNTAEPYAYINFFGTNGTTFDRVVFKNLNTTTGFETDSHSVALGVATRGYVLEEYGTHANGRADAVGRITSAIDLGAVHRGGTFGSKTAYVDNVAEANGDVLNVSGVTTSSNVKATQTANPVNGIAPDDLPVAAYTVTIPDATAAGVVSQSVTAAFTSGDKKQTAVGTGTLAVSGMVYSGQSTWTGKGGGSWGGNPQAASTHSNWSANDGAPGVWTGFEDADTATFGDGVTSSSAMVNVTSAVSVKGITFDNTEKKGYTIAAGPGGSLALKAAAGEAAMLNARNGSHAITAPVTLQSDLNVNVQNRGDRLTVAQLLQSSGGKVQVVTKTGAGTLVLDGTSTYTGSTTISGGTVEVDGTLASAVDVRNTGTLSGTGRISRAVTVEKGGTISPGVDQDSGKLTTVGQIWRAGGAYRFGIAKMTNDQVQSKEGTDYDTIVSSGNLDLTTLSASSTGTFRLEVDDQFTSGFDPMSTYTWQIASFAQEIMLPESTTSTDINSLFAISLSYFEAEQQGNWSVSSSGGSLYLNYTYSAVPEASTMVFGAMAVMPILAHRRRARASATEA